MTEAEAVEVAYRAVGPGAQPTAHLRWMPTQESAGAPQTEMVLCQLWTGPLGVIWLPVPDFVPQRADEAPAAPERAPAAPVKNWHFCYGCGDFLEGPHYHGTVEEDGKDVRVALQDPDKDGIFRSGDRYFRLDPP